MPDGPRRSTRQRNPSDILAHTMFAKARGAVSMPPEMNNNEPAKQTDRRSKARNTAPDPMPQKDRPAKRGRSSIKKDGGSATGSSEPPKKDRKQRGMSAPEEVNQQGRRRSARIAQSEPMASAEPVPRGRSQPAEMFNAQQSKKLMSTSANQPPTKSATPKRASLPPQAAFRKVKTTNAPPETNAPKVGNRRQSAPASAGKMNAPPPRFSRAERYAMKETQQREEEEKRLAELREIERLEKEANAAEERNRMAQRRSSAGMSLPPAPPWDHERMNCSPTQVDIRPSIPPTVVDEPTQRLSEASEAMTEDTMITSNSAAKDARFSIAGALRGIGSGLLSPLRGIGSGLAAVLQNRQGGRRDTNAPTEVDSVGTIETKRDTVTSRVAPQRDPAVRSKKKRRIDGTRPGTMASGCPSTSQPTIDSGETDTHRDTLIDPPSEPTLTTIVDKVSLPPFTETNINIHTQQTQDSSAGSKESPKAPMRGMGKSRDLMRRATTPMPKEKKQKMEISSPVASRVIEQPPRVTDAPTVADHSPDTIDERRTSVVQLGKHVQTQQAQTPETIIGGNRTSCHDVDMNLHPIESHVTPAKDVYQPSPMVRAKHRTALPRKNPVVNQLPAKPNFDANAAMAAAFRRDRSPRPAQPSSSSIEEDVSKKLQAFQNEVNRFEKSRAKVDRPEQAKRMGLSDTPGKRDPMRVLEHEIQSAYRPPQARIPAPKGAGASGSADPQINAQVPELSSANTTPNNSPEKSKLSGILKGKLVPEGKKLVPTPAPKSVAEIATQWETPRTVPPTPEPELPPGTLVDCGIQWKTPGMSEQAGSPLPVLEDSTANAFATPAGKKELEAMQKHRPRGSAPLSIPSPIPLNVSGSPMPPVSPAVVKLINRPSSPAEEHSRRFSEFMLHCDASGLPLDMKDREEFEAATRRVLTALREQENKQHRLNMLKAETELLEEQRDMLKRRVELVKQRKTRLLNQKALPKLSDIQNGFLTNMNEATAIRREHRNAGPHIVGYRDAMAHQMRQKNFERLKHAAAIGNYEPVDVPKSPGVLDPNWAPII